MYLAFAEAMGIFFLEVDVDNLFGHIIIFDFVSWLAAEFCASFDEEGIYLFSGVALSANVVVEFLADVLEVCFICILVEITVY